MRQPIVFSDWDPPVLRGRDLAWMRWTIGSTGSDAILPLLDIAEHLTGPDMDLRGIAGLARDFASDAVNEWSREVGETGVMQPFDADLAVVGVDEELAATRHRQRCAQKKAAWEWLAKPASASAWKLRISPKPTRAACTCYRSASRSSRR